MKNGYFEFLAHVVDRTDPRADRGRNHQLLDMIGLAQCGSIAGANSWADVERYAQRDYQDKQVRRSTKAESNRNRQETRCCIVAPAPVALRMRWPGLKTIGLIHRLREHADGTESAELSYFRRAES